MSQSMGNSTSRLREWCDAVLAFMRRHAEHMRAPHDWTPNEDPGKPNYPADRRGNHTVRPHDQIKPLRAADATGREWTILEIVPVEPIQGYDSLRLVHGRARYELKDGTPVVQRGDGVFEVSGTTLTLQAGAGK